MFKEADIHSSDKFDNKPARFLVDRYPDFFVPPDQEEEYCRLNNITVSRLENGIDVVTALYRKEGAVDAEVNFLFPTGSYFDPLGKSGLTHMTEHLTAYKFIDLANDNLASFNALTNFGNVLYMLNGVASPSYMDTGIWPVIRAFMENFNHNGNSLISFASGVGTERATVMSEVDSNSADYGRQVDSHILKTFLSDNNPYLTNTLGSKTDVNSISDEDIQKSADTIFNPEGLVVTAVAHEFDQPVYKTLSQFLETSLRAIPKQPTHSQPRVSDQMLAQMRETIPAHKLIPTGISNNLVTVAYVWKFNNEPFGPSDMALSLFTELSNNVFFRYARKNGLSYSSDVRRLNISLQSGLFVLSYIAASDGIKDFLTEKQFLSTDILDTISQDEIDKIASRYSLRETIVGDDTYTRIQNIFWSIKNTGRLMDFQKLRTYSHANASDILKWKDYFYQTTPTILLIGDLPGS